MDNQSYGAPWLLIGRGGSWRNACTFLEPAWEEGSISSMKICSEIFKVAKDAVVARIVEKHGAIEYKSQCEKRWHCPISKRCPYFLL